MYDDSDIEYGIMNERANKLYWTLGQDTKLVGCLHELALGGYWNVDTGFRTGYLQELEKMLEEKMPGCGLKAIPNIESRLKTLKKQTMAIAEMRAQSGFSWDDEGCFVSAETRVFKAWSESHKEAKGLNKKYFPHYQTLIKIYGKDRATGERAVDPLGEEISIRQDIHSLSEDDIDATEGVEVSSTDKRPNSTTSYSESRKRVRKSTSGGSSALGEITSSFAFFVQKSNDNVNKLANAICTNQDMELWKKVVDALKRVEALSRSDVMKAARIIIGDTPKCSLLLALDQSDDRLSWVRELIGQK